MKNMLSRILSAAVFAISCNSFSRAADAPGCASNSTRASVADSLTPVITGLNMATSRVGDNRDFLPRGDSKIFSLSRRHARRVYRRRWIRSGDGY